VGTVIVSIPLTPVTIDVPCPPVQVNLPPEMHGTPSWVVGWGIAVLILVLIMTGLLIQSRIEAKTARHKATEEARLKMASLSYGAVYPKDDEPGGHNDF
jgi:hypothetical protein